MPWQGRAMKLKVVLETSPDGGYTVYVPSLPGCISEGDTREDALANIREAIDLYLEPTSPRKAIHVKPHPQTSGARTGTIL